MRNSGPIGGLENIKGRNMYANVEFSTKPNGISTAVKAVPEKDREAFHAKWSAKTTCRIDLGEGLLITGDNELSDVPTLCAAVAHLTVKAQALIRAEFGKEWDKNATPEKWTAHCASYTEFTAEDLMADKPRGKRDDDVVIAKAMGIPLEVFKANKEVIMGALKGIKVGEGEGESKGKKK